MKKSRLLLPFAGLLLFAFLFFYQPVKENQIYQREVKLPEISEVQEESLGDNKMIQQAKSTLENVFAVQIEESDYNISVEYEASQISDYTTAYGKQNLTFANVGFKDKESDEMKYMVTCDTTSGEILMLIQQYASPMGDAYKLLEELEKTATSFLEKMTHLSEEDILYIEDEVQGSTYIAKITMKNSYEHFLLYLDAFDGTVFYYWKVR